MRGTARFWVVVALLLTTGAILLRRGDKDRVPESTPLAQFPETLGSWQGTDIPMDQEVLDVLGQGFFLNRVYSPVSATPNAPKSNPVSLFIGYFPTQRTGQSIHSPQNCLPGAGWTFESSGVTELKAGDAKPLEVGEYVIANGNSKAEVLYWYQSHGRAIASDYKAKLYMLTDSIRYSRSDAALVRVVTSIAPGEDREEAHRRAVEFADRMIPLLPAYVPN